MSQFELTPFMQKLTLKSGFTNHLILTKNCYEFDKNQFINHRISRINSLGKLPNGVSNLRFLTLRFSNFANNMTSSL